MDNQFILEKKNLLWFYEVYIDSAISRENSVGVYREIAIYTNKIDFQTDWVNYIRTYTYFIKKIQDQIYIFQIALHY